ncbi:MAG TPA: alpha/beta fold hydrolase [Micromonosporaceae bacterium]|nr:alpha/beta fold hydrolase [Micromonosporaceae bacterium]
MDVRTTESEIPTGSVRLPADLVVPAQAHGLVLFAHGSGSSRHSPRNRAVAGRLNRHSLATVLVDLLTADEEQLDMQTAQLRFDIDHLADRLADIIDWMTSGEQLPRLPVGLFGASTGAAAALVAAAARPDVVRAVVSRGGRPDLAGSALPNVRAATLLLVGGRDEQVLELNQDAQRQMTAPTELRVIPGATHLFEEPGALEQVAEEAADWFDRHLAG